MRHGFARFMLAHGQTPGPGERPRVAGSLAGAVAGIAALPLLKGTGAAAELADGLRTPGWTIQLLYLASAVIGGLIYSAAFGRAANDRRGGWLFGIAYGFLLWMVGPVALLQLAFRHQFVSGTAAMGVLGANLVSGLLLGLLYRPMYGFVRTPLHRLSRRRQPKKPVIPQGGTRAGS
jgi:hypothetical protein